MTTTTMTTDDDDDDDDDEDDDDYEVIDKTAAELAEEGIEGPGEITVLARKRVPKQPKQRPQRAGRRVDVGERRRGTAQAPAPAPQAARDAAAEERVRDAGAVDRGADRRGAAAPPGGGGGGPVIEYVRGPMRIAAAPVASANPNDAGVAPSPRQEARRWERVAGGGGGGGGGGFRDDGPRRSIDRGRDPPQGQWRPPGGPGAQRGQRAARRERWRPASVGVVAGVGAVAAATGCRCRRGCRRGWSAGAGADRTRWRQTASR